VGAGGAQVVARITGLSVKTIHLGQQDVADSLATRPTERVRVVGGGRARAEKKTPCAGRIAHPCARGAGQERWRVGPRCAERSLDPVP